MADKDPHGPNSFSNYFEVHQRVMRDCVTRGFVLSDNVVAIALGNGNLLMEGPIECLGDIDITIEKILEVTGQAKRRSIRTVEYHYNAHVRGLGNILRYDSPHPDHNQFHHAHRFDVFNGDRDGQVSKCEWPHIGAVIGEVEQWYYDNRDCLPQPQT